MKEKQLKYLNPDSTQTLREGIAELRVAEGAEGDAAETLAPELSQDIDIHDVIHVLFACPTSLSGEIVAHVWTAVGTTTKFADMHRVNAHQDHKKVLAQIGHLRLISIWWRSLPRILRVLVNAKRMPRRLPVEGFESFLDCRLCDLRADFQIRIVAVKLQKRGRDDNGGGAALRSIRAGSSRLLPRKA